MDFTLIFVSGNGSQAAINIDRRAAPATIIGPTGYRRPPSQGNREYLLLACPRLSSTPVTAWVDGRGSGAAADLRIVGAARADLVFYTRLLDALVWTCATRLSFTSAARTPTRSAHARDWADSAMTAGVDAEVTGLAMRIAAECSRVVEESRAPLADAARLKVPSYMTLEL